MSQYKPILGFVQFDVNEREVNGQTVRDFAIQPGGSGDVPQIRVTLWPEYADFKVAKDDLVVVEGLVKTNSKGGKTYYNLTPTKIKNLGPAFTKSTEEVENPVEEEDEDFDPGF